MKNASMVAWSALVVAGVVLIVGCQPQAVERDARYKVTGTVTLNGDPVEGAAVSFIPKGPGDGAVGKTDAGGKFSLTTYGGGDGALPGDYAVKITKFEGAAAEDAGAAGPVGEGEDQYPADYDGGISNEDEGGGDEAKNLLPAKYADASTSGLEATVEANDSNSFDFALEGAAK